MSRFINFKKEPSDTFDARRVKTEPSNSSTNVSAVPNSSSKNDREFCIKERPIKKEPTDTFDASRVRTGPNSFDQSKPYRTNSSSRNDRKFLGKGNRSRKRNDFSHEDSKNFDKDEKKCTKREADSSLEGDYPNVKIGRHECSIYAIFHRRRFRDIVRALSEGSYAYNLPDPNSRFLSNESHVEDDVRMDMYVEKLKSPLPPDTSQPDSEIEELLCISQGYEWRNAVENPTIAAKDRSIKQVVESVLVGQDRYKNDLNNVLADLNDAVKFVRVTNRWNWFGSYLNGLVCLDSEIHLHYECVPEFESRDGSEIPENIVDKMFEFLKAHKKFKQLNFDARARYPCIRMSSKRHTVPIEITFSNDLNSYEMKVTKSLLTKIYLDMSQNLKYLTVFVKIVMQRYRVHGAAVKFQTYTIFWLVVFFMQLKKLLPTVIDVRKAAKVTHYVAGWNCSLPESYSYPTESVSLYALLLEFFDFYKDFDFLKYVICPYLGRVFLLSDFEKLQIPKNEFSVYMKQLEDSRQLAFCRNVINLQDPSDLSCNVAELVTSMHANHFKVVCHRLSQRFAKSIEQIEHMDCFCNLLTNKDFYAYSPYNLIQYGELMLRTMQDLNFGESRERKLNQMHMLEAIRKIMESIFEFEKKRIVIGQNVTQDIKHSTNAATVENTLPVVYFSYCSSESTWRNDCIKEIIPRKEDEKEPVRIYITCEVGLEEHFVKIFYQGNVHIVKFLRRNLLKLLRSALEEIVPNVAL